LGQSTLFVEDGTFEVGERAPLLAQFTGSDVAFFVDELHQFGGQFDRLAGVVGDAQ